MEDLLYAISLLNVDEINENTKLLIFTEGADQYPRLTDAIKNQLILIL